MQDRHCAYFARYVEGMLPQMNGPEQVSLFDDLEREYDNLRTVLEWSLGEGGSVETSLRMAEVLGVFWNQRGLWKEGKDWLERMLQQGSAAPGALRIRAIGAARVLVWQSGDMAGAQRLDEEWLAVSNAIGDKSGMAYALRGLATDASERGELDKASALLEESLALFRELGSKQGLRAILTSLGTLAELRGEYDTAVTHYGEAYTLSQELRDQTEIANSIWCLGAAERNRRNYETAQGLFEASLEMSRELNYGWCIAASLHFLGIIAQAQGDHPRAKVLLKESLPLYRHLGHRRGIGLCLTSQAEELRWAGQAERAAVLLAAAERCNTNIGRPLVPVDQEHHDAVVTATRALLDQRIFASAWARGERMALEEAVAFALENDT